MSEEALLQNGVVGPPMLLRIGVDGAVVELHTNLATVQQTLHLCRQPLASGEDGAPAFIALSNDPGEPPYLFFALREKITHFNAEVESGRGFVVLNPGAVVQIAAALLRLGNLEPDPNEAAVAYELRRNLLAEAGLPDVEV